jgi:apolipoprotein N-acyltransferase
VLSRQADPQPAGGQETDVLPGLRLSDPRRALAAGLAASALSGVILSLANPPADLGWIAFLAMIPLLWAVGGVRRPRRGALFGAVFGLVYYGALLRWLLPFGLIAWLPLVASQAAYAAMFGALLPLLWRSDRPFRSAFLAAGLWTVIDWVRGVWPIGGFTWGGLGYTQHGDGFLLPLASVTGVWGVTFVVLAVNAVLLAALLRLRSGRRVAVAAVGAGVVLTLAPAAIPVPSATGPRLDVAVVQGNVPLALASDRLLQTTEVVRNQIRLHRRLASDPPHLAVWPENSLYDDPAENLDLGASVAEAIRSVGSPTLVGGIARAPGDRFYNQALLYSERGRIAGRYTKIHLVPFGEYIPFRSVLGWTDRYRRGNALLAGGHQIRLFRVHGMEIGSPICFENVFPDLFRRFVAEGANVMIVTTNDSSFLFSPASREHVIMSQLRAVETGRWIVQGAISGESAIVRPDGTVVSRTDLFTQAILRYAVPSSTATTIYVRFGDWFPWACGVVVGVLLVLAALRRRRAGQAAGGEGGGSTGVGGTPPAGEREGAEPVLPISGSGRKVLVILPTYNERATIGRVLEGVLAAGPDVDALVIDDNSPDGTGEVVQVVAEREPRVRLIRRSGKQGLASAYLLGFRTGIADGYDVLVEMDSDLSHQPGQLTRLLQGSERYDLTIGSRYVPGGGVANWSRRRVALSRAGNAYARAALRLPVHDATSGYRAFRRAVLEALLPEGIHSDGYGFQVELAWRAWRAGFTVGEVPITFREREHGRSKLSRRIVVEALAKIARWGLQERFGRSGGRRSSNG